METWVVVSVVIAAVAIVFQATMLAMMFVQMRKTAERVALEQHIPGNTTAISWEDKDGRWHEELSQGGDRPETEVKG